MWYMQSPQMQATLPMLSDPSLSSEHALSLACGSGGPHGVRIATVRVFNQASLVYRWCNACVTLVHPLEMSCCLTLGDKVRGSERERVRE